MKPDFLGYALNSLDPPALAAMDEYLRDHPEAQVEVETIRQLAAPLAWDTDYAPPAGLAERTLARIAATESSKKVPSVIGTRGFSWRRLSATAAVLLVSLTASGLGISWLASIRTQRPGGEPNAVQVVACKDNLQKVFSALSAYGDAHGQQYPNVTMAQKPSNVAGKVILILQDDGLLPPNFDVTCPSAASLGAPNLDYAYSLGYLKDGQVIGPRVEEGKPASLMPLMADSSPLDPARAGQSVNHGGSGQNVLFYDGHVAFCKTRYVGVNGDDIYLNKMNKVASGIGWSDAVLTNGTVPP